MQIKNRLYIFDFLRAFAVIFVLIGHYFCHYQKQLEFLELHTIGVGIFFFISGYLILSILERSTIQSFVFKRMFRLLPMLIVATTIFIVFFEKIKYLPFKLILTSTFIGDIFNQYNIAGIDTWTLNVEVRFYLIIFITFFVFRRNFFTNIKNVNYFIIALYLLSLLLFFFSVLIKKQISFSNFIWNNICINFIYFGSFYWLYSKQFISKTKFLLLCLFNMCFIFVLFGIAKTHAPTAYLVASFLCLLAMYFADYIVELQIIKNIAAISYSVYLLHHPLLIKFGFISIPMVLIISYCTYNYIEKPMINFAKKFS